VVVAGGELVVAIDSAWSVGNERDAHASSMLLFKTFDAKEHATWGAFTASKSKLDHSLLSFWAVGLPLVAEKCVFATAFAKSKACTALSRLIVSSMEVPAAKISPAREKAPLT